MAVGVQGQGGERGARVLLFTETEVAARSCMAGRRPACYALARMRKTRGKRKSDWVRLKGKRL